MRNLRHYSGTTTCLVWVGAAAFGITFCAGLARLIGRFFK